MVIVTVTRVDLGAYSFWWGFFKLEAVADIQSYESLWGKVEFLSQGSFLDQGYLATNQDSSTRQQPFSLPRKHFFRLSATRLRAARMPVSGSASRLYSLLRCLPLWSIGRGWEMWRLRSAVAPESWLRCSLACRVGCGVAMRQGFQSVCLQYLFAQNEIFKVNHDDSTLLILNEFYQFYKKNLVAYIVPWTFEYWWVLQNF